VAVEPRAEAEKRHLDGTHRTVEPAETLDRLLPLRGRAGITRVGVITGLDVIGIPVVMVCRPNGRSLSVSQGKGVDLVSAKVSGIMEALEAWHAEHVLLPLRLATYRELCEVARVVDVGELPRPSWSRFHPDLSILWVEGTDVLTAERVWVPYESVHLDFRSPGPQGTGCFLANGTGLAAGNHVLEAVSHGLCEVVERDAFALWGARPAAEQLERQLDLDTVDDSGCRTLLETFEAAGVGVVVADLTTDVGLPVFAATIVDRRVDRARRLPAAMGGGCHTDRGVALSRALTEAAQSRLTLIAGSRDDCPPAHYRAVKDSAAIERHLTRLDAKGSRSFREVPHRPGASVDADVAHELDRLRASGVRETVLVDLTRPDFGVPVVRMIVPGLEGWTDKVAAGIPGRRLRAVQEAAWSR
jgi:ribosomal protein S12 methylthiotransferase accessory factor